MGVDVIERFFFTLQIAHTGQQQPVFEDIGVIAGMVMVLIAEHVVEMQCLTPPPGRYKAGHSRRFLPRPAAAGIQKVDYPVTVAT